MRVSRDELRFDFGEARFRLPRDRELLGWIVDQFLYGEVTGIQVGHWLYAAPSLEAATFFARQASEELAHVRVFLRIHALLGTTPGPAHPVIRFLFLHPNNRFGLRDGLISLLAGEIFDISRATHARVLAFRGLYYVMNAFGRRITEPPARHDAVRMSENKA